MASRRRNLALLTASILLAPTIFELVTLLFLAHPRLAAGALRRYLRNVYILYERPLPQVESSRWDPELFYTLRPGESVHHTREFDARISANSLGVRDDEQSLQAPEVIVLGDSYAMGWGVSAQEAFPALLEGRLGARVLNAAVPSYATPREMLMLDRIDRSHARKLLIQYCHNDLGENLSFLRGKASAPRTLERYQQALDGDRPRRRYWFGKYLWHLLKGEMRIESEPPATADEEAAAFVHAVLHAGRASLDGMQLYVLVWEDEALVAALEAQRRSSSSPLIRSLGIISLVGRLQPQHYYLLDDHWNAAGHRLVADAVIAAFSAPGGLPRE